MRLICQKTLFLVAFVAIGCSESTGPRTVAMQFTLNNISGRPLPTYFAPTPALTPTIVSNKLTLYKDGTAETVEHRIESNGTDHTVTDQTQYTLKGAVLDFAYHCPGGAMCIAAPHGTIVGNRLALDVSGGTGTVIFNYSATSE